MLSRDGAIVDIDQRNEELSKLYKSGQTLSQISKQSGLSTGQLSRIFKKRGVVRPKYELDLVYFEANAGKTHRDISEETGITLRRVGYLY